MDQRTLDQLVRTITRELADTPGAPRAARPAAPPGRTRGTRVKGGTGPAAPAGTPATGACWLVDNWRVREAAREEFLSFYRTYVAGVVKQLPGYRSGRVLVATPGTEYTWHVQALYEFDSDAVLDVFHRDFDRLVRAVDPRHDMTKVLDEMDQWVLAHEDGVLTEVWP